MDNENDFVYFVNSQGERAVLSSPENRNYWELRGRSGFTAPEVDVFTEKYASGAVKYYGRALQPRSCSMQMVCVGESTAERDKVFFEMVNVLLDPDGTGEGKLYVKRSDGAMVYINCVYSGGMNITEEYRRLHKFSLEFFAADPWFYGAEKNYKISSMTFQSDEYTFEDVKPNTICKFTVGPESSPTNPVHIGGGYIENVTTSKKITFARDSVNVILLPSGYSLMIDFNPRNPQIILLASDGKIQDGSKYIDVPNTDFDFGLIPGQNVIDFSHTYTDIIDFGYMYTQRRYLGA